MLATPTRGSRGTLGFECSLRLVSLLEVAGVEVDSLLLPSRGLGLGGGNGVPLELLARGVGFGFICEEGG